MKPREFAEKHFGPFRERNGEIVPRFCPFCGGGQKKDRETFAMSIEDGAYNCKRGKCGVRGSFKDLCDHFSERADNDSWKNSNRTRKRKYKKPEVKTTEPKSKVRRYLEQRGFSEETIQRHGLREHKGLIAFPYYQDGELVLVKYRRPEKYDGEGSKYWQEGGGKPVLWGMDDCTPDKQLIITEGEFDAMSLTEAGVENVTSIPFGTENLDWIQECWDFLEQFERIILWADNDEAGQKMLSEVVPRLDAVRCAVVKSEHSDVNIQLYKEGPESVRRAVENAEDVPIKNLLRMSEVETIDPSKIGRVLSGFGGINKHIGGYLYGTVTVWTGDNGSGKSTFLLQEMVESVEQGRSVVIYSGEIPHGILKHWFHRQLAGQGNVQCKQDELADREVYYVPKSKGQVMEQWYDDKLYLYNHLDSTKPDDILEMFRGAARRYGCKVFLLDNLMEINYESSEREYYYRQSEFVSRLIEFADRYNAHVHIVAHPKKSESTKLKKNDIAGLKEIQNKAHRIAAIHRIDDENEKKFEESLRDCSAVIDILKDRIYGTQNKSVGLNFEPMSLRFWQPSEPSAKVKAYGWEQLEGQGKLEEAI